MKLLDLFSGIGGFSLGLEAAGFETVAFCEIDPYCRAVLKKHWPEVPCFDDVCKLDATGLAAVGIPRIDAICGGFPCQDISIAGKGAGLAGARSGLWYEIARLVGALRPDYVVLENVAALLGRGLDTVLGDLATLGYDAEWHCIPASHVGAPHQRDRVWVVAYPDNRPKRTAQAVCAGRNAAVAGSQALADADEFARVEGRPCHAAKGTGRGHSHRGGERASDVADANRPGRQQQRRPEPVRAELTAAECGGWWAVEPDVGRMAHGIPSRVDRLTALGNAIVPQVAEVIGRAIMRSE